MPDYQDAALSPPHRGGAGGGQEIEKRRNALSNLLELKPFRRDLRNEPTKAESRLWGYLRESQLGGKKFRRQHSIGRYILDFYCPSERLAIELDGAQHIEPTAETYDERRTLFLEKLGVRVLRFPNYLVLESIGLVLEKIAEGFHHHP